MRWLVSVVALAACDKIIGLDYHDPGPEPGNEDGDSARNDDDNCPSVSNDQDDDMDDDGVGDACDPLPVTPGDRIVAFYGFDVADDLRWMKKNGAWTTANGQLSIASAGSLNQSYFTRNAPPIMPPYTVETFFTIDATQGYAVYGVTANLDDAASGASCMLIDHSNASDQVEAYWNGGITQPIATLASGERYRARFTVDRAEIHCDIEGTTSGQGGAASNDLDEARLGYVGFEVRGDATLRFDYIVVYGKD